MTDYHDLDGDLLYIKKKNDDVIVKFGSRYNYPGKKALRLRDNGNGYDVKQYSLSSINPDIRFSLDYDTAHYLWLALSELLTPNTESALEPQK